MYKLYFLPEIENIIALEDFNKHSYSISVLELPGMLENEEEIRLEVFLEVRLESHNFYFILLPFRLQILKYAT
jgi:hypothetical protein